MMMIMVMTIITTIIRDEGPMIKDKGSTRTIMMIRSMIIIMVTIIHFIIN
jgi:hypothetical protein